MLNYLGSSDDIGQRQNDLSPASKAAILEIHLPRTFIYHCFVLSILLPGVGPSCYSGEEGFCIKTRMPSSALLDQLVCPPGPGTHWPAAAGVPGPGGYNNWSSSALEGILDFISPLYWQNIGYFGDLSETMFFLPIQC